MAVEWIVCSVCNGIKNPGYTLRSEMSVQDQEGKFGEHEHGESQGHNFGISGNGKRCPGSDKPPKRRYWGTSNGLSIEASKALRESDARWARMFGG